MPREGRRKGGRTRREGGEEEVKRRHDGEGRDPIIKLASIFHSGVLSSLTLVPPSTPDPFLPAPSSLPFLCFWVRCVRPYAPYLAGHRAWWEGRPVEKDRCKHRRERTLMDRGRLTMSGCVEREGGMGRKGFKRV